MFNATPYKTVRCAWGGVALMSSKINQNLLIPVINYDQ